MLLLNVFGIVVGVMLTGRQLLLEAWGTGYILVYTAMLCHVITIHPRDDKKPEGGDKDEKKPTGTELA